MRFGPDGWSADEHETMVRMAAEGCPMSQVAKVLGRSRNAIAGRAIRHGIKFLGIVKRGPKGPRGPKQVTAQVIRFPKPPKATAAPRAVAKPASPPKPLKVVTQNTDLMVQDYLAKHGARRFEPGFSTDYHNLKNYLQERGVSLNLKSSSPYVSHGRGRPRKCTWGEVIAIADRFRVAEGMTPILRSSAA